MEDLLPQAAEQEGKKCMFFMLPSDIDAEVTGLIANKLLAIYQRPLFVLRGRVEVDNETGEIIKHEYSGSMRAIGTSSFKEYVESTSYGWIAGHENAAGFGVDVDEFDDFKVAIEDALKDVEFSICVEADIELEPNQINDLLIKQLVAFNRISGADCPPIKVLIRTNDYEVSTFSTKKHLKIVDNDTGLLIVKWNCSDWETMDNNGEIVAVGTLSSPVYGRKHFTQLTIDEYTQQNE
jgi:single-stranded DNA-specific DHH superfamily exonuclease